MKITTNNGVANIYTPYNADFVAKIKNIGGRKWNAAEKCWTIPESEIETARKYMTEVFGETDQADEGERISVRIRFNKDTEEERKGITIFGKEIAKAWGRDSGARPGEDATVESGTITSGGSRNHWTTKIEEGTVIKLRNIPEAALQIESVYDITVERIEDAPIDRTALEQEKEKLLARLEEIEKLLA